MVLELKNRHNVQHVSQTGMECTVMERSCSTLQVLDEWKSRRRGLRAPLLKSMLFATGRGGGIAAAFPLMI